MRFLYSLFFIVLAVIGGAQRPARAQEEEAAPQRLWTDFETGYPHTNLATIACAQKLEALIDKQRKHVELRAFEDNTLLCTSTPAHAEAVIITMQTKADADETAHIILRVDAPADASPSVLADYRAMLHSAVAAVQRHVFAAADLARAQDERRSEHQSQQERVDSHLVVAGAAMMTTASILTGIAGLVIAGSTTYPGTSQAWPFVPFVGMTVFSATYTQVADCACDRTLSVVLSGVLDAVEIAGLVLALVGALDHKPRSSGVAWKPGALTLHGTF